MPSRPASTVSNTPASGPKTVSTTPDLIALMAAKHIVVGATVGLVSLVSGAVGLEPDAG